MDDQKSNSTDIDWFEWKPGMDVESLYEHKFLVTTTGGSNYFISICKPSKNFNFADMLEDPSSNKWLETDLPRVKILAKDLVRIELVRIKEVMRSRPRLPSEGKE